MELSWAATFAWLTCLPRCVDCGSVEHDSFTFGLAQLVRDQNPLTMCSSRCLDSWNWCESVIWRHCFVSYCHFWRPKIQNKQMSWRHKAQWLYKKLSAADKSRSLHFSFCLRLLFQPDNLTTLHHWGNVVPEYWLGVNLSPPKHTAYYVFVEEIANLILLCSDGLQPPICHHIRSYFKCYTPICPTHMHVICVGVVIARLKGHSTDFTTKGLGTGHWGLPISLISLLQLV